MNPNNNCFDSLPDDALLAIASWVAATGVANVARCLKVNRRLRSVLSQPTFLQQIFRSTSNNDLPEAVQSLEHLALWETVQEANLFEENRIGFDYASVDISPDESQGFHREDILYSQQRLGQVGQILRRFPNAFCRVVSHCGTGAPLGIAEPFSVARGMSVVNTLLSMIMSNASGSDEEDFLEHYYNHPNDLATTEQRIFLTPWGRQIAEIARESQHRYARVARRGKGWVEIYICHGEDLEMPARPDFYQGQNRDVIGDESDEDTNSDGNIGVVVPFQNEAMELDESDDDDRPIENMWEIEGSSSDDSDEDV